MHKVNKQCPRPFPLCILINNECFLILKNISANCFQSYNFCQSNQHMLTSSFYINSITNYNVTDNAIVVTATYILPSKLYLHHHCTNLINIFNIPCRKWLFFAENDHQDKKIPLNQT